MVVVYRLSWTGKFNLRQIGKGNIQMEVITLAEDKRSTSEMEQKFAANLNPDDLDVRNEQDMTKEQKQNSPEAKKHEENNKKA